MSHTATAGSLYEFGPGDAYLGFISDPSRLRSQTGVIVFGMGRRESRIARRLAALGLVVMQAQLFKNFADIRSRLQFYDESGVAACSEVIDELISKRPVTQIVLMGDCAEGNLIFNTALIDQRVVGLILTNPNLEAQLASLNFLQRLPMRLFDAAHWRRMLTGESTLLKAVLRRFRSRSADQWLAERSSFSKDLIVPLDFDRKLSTLLTERPVRCLLGFSQDRNGLEYFRRFCWGALRPLISVKRLTVEVMPVDARVVPTDDRTAWQFADIVADWANETLLSGAAQKTEVEAPRQEAALADWSAHATIVDRFEDVARLYPQRLAVRDQSCSLTYAQLAALAGAIAAAITDSGAPAGPVGVLLGHEARFPGVILGVLAAGRICVPLDADHPAERNGRIAKHSGVTLLIATAELAGKVRALFPAGLAVIDLDAIGVAEASRPATAAATRPRPDDVACVLYTSGSTGAPKGVFQNHRGLLHDTKESVGFTGVSCQDRIAIFYPPCVIAGLLTLLIGLMTGATMEVLPPRLYGRTALAREIRARKVTEMSLSPTLFRHLADSLAAGECFDDMRLVTLGGERVDWSDFEVFRRVCPPAAKMRVHLGATECWTLHTQWTIDASVRAICPRLPVGVGIPGRRVDIIGENGKPLPNGEIGEVRVTSRHIALGYWRDPELTARSFTVDPDDPLQRQYRTGDLVRRRIDGLVEFVGRKDKQIKLHGYRIEPDEVETALKACTGVAAAAVLVRRDAAGMPLALAGYVQLQPAERGLSADRITAMVRERVPPYMMPAEILILDELPWLPNFKIDRQRLEQIDAAHLSERLPADSSPLVGELIEAFKQVTKAPRATPGDNVLSLGGDSLQALELMLEIGRRFRVVVPEQAQDPTRTIAQWAVDISTWRRLDAAQWTA